MICVLRGGLGGRLGVPGARACSPGPPTWWCSSAASTSTTCSPRPRPARPTSRSWPSTHPDSTPRPSSYLHRHRVRPVAVVAEDGAGARPTRQGCARRAGTSRPWWPKLTWGCWPAWSPRPMRRRRRSHRATTPALATPTLLVGRRSSLRCRPDRHGLGPAGARRGVTTVAVTFAAVLAARGRATVLVDADPYGGAVAQQLGVLDEVSGLLAAARLAATGGLAERFATVQRSLGGGLAPGHRAAPARPLGRGAARRRRAPPRGRVGARPRRGRHRVQPRAGPRCGLRFPSRPQHDDARRPRRSPTRSWSWAAPTRSGCPGWRVGWSSCATWPEQRRLACVVNRLPRHAGLVRGRDRRRWSRGSPASVGCTSCPRTGRRWTARWSPAARSSRAATRRWPGRWQRSSTRSSRTAWSPTPGRGRVRRRTAGTARRR